MEELKEIAGLDSTKVEAVEMKLQEVVSDGRSLCDCNILIDNCTHIKAGPLLSKHPSVPLPS